MTDSDDPIHYRYSRHECSDVIEDLCLPWNTANVIKYCWRYRHKGGLADLKKARVYLDREIAKWESAQ